METIFRLILQIYIKLGKEKMKKKTNFFIFHHLF